MTSEIYRKDGMIQVYPTTKGWTVRAFYWKKYPKGFTQKRWPIKESTVHDHRFTDLKHRVETAIDWLEEEIYDK